MGKILIIYSEQKDFTKFAQALKQGFTKQGHQVEMQNLESTSRPISFNKYDLLLAGSPIFGFLGGKIDEEFGEFLSDCKRTVGQKAVAFVNSKFIGTTKALKKVMAELESVGCMVYDFRSFSNAKEAEEFAKNFDL